MDATVSEVDATQIKTRLEVTEQQIGLLEKELEKASRLPESMDPRLYDAVIASYDSVLCELREERDNYRKELGLE